MRYAIEAFDRETDFLNFVIDLSDGCDAQLTEIMGWSAAQRGDEGYNLDAAQIAALEALTNRRFYRAGHIFQLTCNLD